MLANIVTKEDVFIIEVKYFLIDVLFIFYIFIYIYSSDIQNCSGRHSKIYYFYNPPHNSGRVSMFHVFILFF